MTNPAVDFDFDTLTGMAPLRRVVFSLGSNVGDSLDTLEGALEAIAETPGLMISDVSSVYRTAPQGGVEQDDFLNIVVIADSTLTTQMLLERCQAVEEAFGRTRDVRWGPRTLDVDLICVGTREVHRENLELPHPRAHERAFVLVPWLEADPAAEIPGRGRVADLVAAVADQPIEKLTDVELLLP